MGDYGQMASELALSQVFLSGLQGGPVGGQVGGQLGGQLTGPASYMAAMAAAMGDDFADLLLNETNPAQPQ